MLIKEEFTGRAIDCPSMGDGVRGTTFKENVDYVLVVNSMADVG